MQRHRFLKFSVAVGLSAVGFFRVGIASAGVAGSLDIGPLHPFVPNDPRTPFIAGITFDGSQNPLVIDGVSCAI